MNYEYNGNLLFFDRIENVANDIISKYPIIQKSKAMFVATLESPITEEVTDEFKFMRLYNIMFIINGDKELEKEIFNEIKDIYKKIYGTNNRIDDIMNNLINYMKNGGVFPIENNL